LINDNEIIWFKESNGDKCRHKNQSLKNSGVVEGDRADVLDGATEEVVAAAGVLEDGWRILGDKH
jgi:hypothetical protein